MVVIREGEGLEASFEIFIQSISVAGPTPSLLKMILYYKLHGKKKKRVVLMYRTVWEFVHKTLWVF